VGNVVCYNDRSSAMNLTTRFSGRCLGVAQREGMSDERLAEQIRGGSNRRSLRLAGHPRTTGCWYFARKSQAPIQSRDRYGRKTG